MKKIVAAVVLSINGLYGMGVAEFWERAGIVDSVSVTSRDMTLTLSSHNSMSSWGIWIPGEQRGRDVVPGEKVAIPPSQAIVFQGRHAHITFTPVSFKTQHKGFRMERTVLGFSSSAGRPADIAYIAFSDAPLSVGEDDVEMILEGGEWKKFKAPPSPPSPEKPQPAVRKKLFPPGRAGAGVTGDAPDTVSRRLPYLWLGLGIILCALVALFAVRKKRA